MTLSKAIALLGKRVWVVVFYGNHRYGEVRRGTIHHVTIHDEKMNRGEWHAYVSTGSGGNDYAGDRMFIAKQEAEAALKSLIEAARTKAQEVRDDD